MLTTSYVMIYNQEKTPGKCLAEVCHSGIPAILTPHYCLDISASKHQWTFWFHLPMKSPLFALSLAFLSVSAFAVIGGDGLPHDAAAGRQARLRQGRLSQEA